MPLPVSGVRWPRSPAIARRLQTRLAQLVDRSDHPCRCLNIAGLDAAFSPDGERVVGVAVVWSTELCRVVDSTVAWRRLRFPYIPGLLSFREAPVLLAALNRLRVAPDLLLCDGQGIAHPRRFGLASHLGLLCQLPSVGCAKSRLVGTHASPGAHRGSNVPLMDGADQIGVVLRTRANVRPVYVSIGHRISLPASIQVVLQCCTRFRLPEPTRLADQLTKRVRVEG